MSNFDDKLRDILDMCEAKEPYSYDAIAQIKAAFADEVMPLVNQMAELSYQPGAHIMTREEGVALMPETFMTGPEWYDRFKKEFKTYAGDYSQGWQEEVLEVAQRAAGIDESKDK